MGCSEVDSTIETDDILASIANELEDDSTNSSDICDTLESDDDNSGDISGILENDYVIK